MKEWSNKPSALVETASSPVKTVGSSPVVRTSSPLVTTSGPVIQTGSLSTTVAGGGSSHLAQTSSRVASISTGLLGEAKGAGIVKAAALGAPAAAGMLVGAVAAGVYGVSNIMKYGKNEKSGTQAVKDTVKGSAGLGLSAALGVAAGNAVAGTSLAVGTTLVVPMAAGVAVAYASLKIWHKLFFKQEGASEAKSSS